MNKIKNKNNKKTNTKKKCTKKYLYENNKVSIEIKIIIKYNEESSRRAQTSANTSNGVKICIIQ